MGDVISSPEVPVVAVIPPQSAVADTSTTEVLATTNDGRKPQKAITKKWSLRQLPVMLFGVIRHTHRADVMGATWNGRSWTQTEDFAKHPMDPPLSDEGLKEADEVANRISAFLEERQGGEIHVVVSSPYLRCLQTAVAVCRKLGGRVRLMIDFGLGEVYGPEVFGDNEPSNIVRTKDELKEHCQDMDLEFIKMPVGKWPSWPETLAGGRTRYAERLLAYLSRGSKARRNFLLVSHADCVGACLALMPSHEGRTIESVGYGGMFLASRAPAGKRVSRAGSIGSSEGDAVVPDESPLIMSLPRPSAECSLPSNLREWWGNETESDRNQLHEEVLADLSLIPWQMETWNTRLGHRWCNGTDYAVANAMNALSKCSHKGPPSQRQVEQLLGALGSKRLDASSESLELQGTYSSKTSDRSDSLCESIRRGGSRMSDLSYETYLFGCSKSELGEEITSSAAMPSHKGQGFLTLPKIMAFRRDKREKSLNLSPVAEVAGQTPRFSISDSDTTPTPKDHPSLLRPLNLKAQFGTSTLMQRRTAKLVA